MFHLIRPIESERKARAGAEDSVRRAMGFMLAIGCPESTVVDNRYRLTLQEIAAALLTNYGEHNTKSLTRATADNAVSHYSNINYEARGAIIAQVKGYTDEWRKTLTEEAKALFALPENKRIDWLNANRPNLRFNLKEKDIVPILKDVTGECLTPAVERIPHTAQTASAAIDTYKAMIA